MHRHAPICMLTCVCVRGDKRRPRLEALLSCQRALCSNAVWPVMLRWHVRPSLHLGQLLMGPQQHLRRLPLHTAQLLKSLHLPAMTLGPASGQSTASCAKAGFSRGVCALSDKAQVIQLIKHAADRYEYGESTCAALLASRHSAGAIASTKLRLRASGCPQLAISAATLAISRLSISPRSPAMQILPRSNLGSMAACAVGSPVAGTYGVCLLTVTPVVHQVTDPCKRGPHAETATV